MKNSKKSLIQQIERIPMDEVLREEVLAGVEGLSDSEAQTKAQELKVALDRLPHLAERLRSARNRGKQRPADPPTEDVQSSKPPLEPQGRQSLRMVAKGRSSGT